MLNNNIRVERAIKRVSQQDVADAIGVTRQTIFSIENNKYVPSTELALRLSAYSVLSIQKNSSQLTAANIYGAQNEALLDEVGAF